MKSLKLTTGFIVALCVLLMAGIFSPLRAAGPITHALLTEHLFRIYPQYNHEQKMAFRVGTLFSGVSNLGGLSPEEVSFPGVTLDDILYEDSPFFAGMMFHYYVDNLRDDFIFDSDYEELLFDLPVEHNFLYLKFLEDQIMFPTLDKGPWKEAVSNIHIEEQMWGVDEAILKQWHYLLDMSFTYQPSTLIFFANLKGNGLLNVPADEVKIWNETFERVSERSDVQAYVSDLLDMFAFEITED